MPRQAALDAGHAVGVHQTAGRGPVQDGHGVSEPRLTDVGGNVIDRWIA